MSTVLDSFTLFMDERRGLLYAANLSHLASTTRFDALLLADDETASVQARASVLIQKAAIAKEIRVRLSRGGDQGDETRVALNVTRVRRVECLSLEAALCRRVVRLTARGDALVVNNSAVYEEHFRYNLFAQSLLDVPMRMSLDDESLISIDVTLSVICPEELHHPLHGIFFSQRSPTVRGHTTRLKARVAVESVTLVNLKLAKLMGISGDGGVYTVSRVKSAKGWDVRRFFALNASTGVWRFEQPGYLRALGMDMRRHEFNAAEVFGDEVRLVAIYANDERSCQLEVRVFSLL